MKILVESSKFAKACALANKNIPGKTTLPIIQNLHIVAEGDMLKVSSTDMETWVVYNVPATVEYDDVPASFCLDAGCITSLLQDIPSQPITIEVKEHKQAAMVIYYAKITHSCGTSELPVQNADEYPSLHPITREGHTVPAEVLKKSIQTCRFSLYADAEAKPNLASVCLDFKGNSLVAVASDGNTLARLEHKDMVGEKCQYLVPAKAMSLMVPLLDDVLKDKEAMDVVVIRKNSNIICMQTDSASIYYCQTTYPYPRYDSVIPPVKDVRFEAVMNRQDLISAITRASLFTSAESMRLIFRFDGTKEYVTVIGRCIDFATSGEEKVKCEFSKSEQFNIAFRSTLLKNVLLHLSTEQVRFNLIERSRAVTIVEENGNPDILMLIMPMLMEEA